MHLTAGHSIPVSQRRRPQSGKGAAAPAQGQADLGGTCTQGKPQTQPIFAGPILPSACIGSIELLVACVMAHVQANKIRETLALKGAQHAIACLYSLWH